MRLAKMRSLIRWTVKLGVMSSAVLGTWFITSLPAWAIPRDEMLKILESVPMFAITDPEGAPLVQNLDQNRGLVNVFLSPSQAQTLLEELRAQKPEVGNRVSVSLVSLDETFLFAEANEESGLLLNYIPTQTQLEYAQRVWTNQRRPDQPEQFPGTPLFIARAGANQNYLSYRRGDSEEVVPFFFDPVRLDEVVSDLIAQDPSVQGTITVEVVPLEGVLKTLEADDDPDLGRIELVPLRETIEFINANSPQNSTAPAGSAGN
ncbi:MAG: hypothetical protein F6J87_28790 [Spirulina sp. SIO3F2]|nr:hypothetical protein [Spirulina sp. SIO3F2]